MSQVFDDNSNVLPYTALKLVNVDDIQHFEGYEYKKPITLIGYSKGKGYAGVMKRWNFAGQVETHGQKSGHRAPGSIGAQGQGRVIPGKKMAGRLGQERITIITKFLAFDKENMIVHVKGGVPGSRESEVVIYVESKESAS